MQLISIDGTAQFMVLSSEHENYAELIKQIIGTLSLRLRIKVLHFGSATMRIEGRRLFFVERVEAESRDPSRAEDLDLTVRPSRLTLTVR